MTKEDGKRFYEEWLEIHHKEDCSKSYEEYKAYLYQSGVR
jgi:hypothetical protein